MMVLRGLSMEAGSQLEAVGGRLYGLLYSLVEYLVQ